MLEELLVLTSSFSIYKRVNRYRLGTTPLDVLSLRLMTKAAVQTRVDLGELLPLMEEFYTIQGEGAHTDPLRIIPPQTQSETRPETSVAVSRAAPEGER